MRHYLRICMMLQVSRQLRPFQQVPRRRLIAFSSTKNEDELIVAEIEYQVKRSRFIGRAGLAQDWEGAQSFIEKYSDVKARHNCYAWLSKTSGRSSDDGEPSGTAGKPIRESIQNLGSNNVVVLVTRYKPSTAPMLGAGGLIRAYGQAAREAIRKLADILPEALLDQHFNSNTTIEEPSFISLTAPLSQVGTLQQLIASWERCHTYAVSRLSEEYDATSISLLLSVSETSASSLVDEAERRLGPSSLVSLHDVNLSDHHDGKKSFNDEL